MDNWRDLEPTSATAKDSQFQYTPHLQPVEREMQTEEKLAVADNLTRRIKAKANKQGNTSQVQRYPCRAAQSRLLPLHKGEKPAGLQVKTTRKQRLDVRQGGSRSINEN
ncbi:MAG: hypothetical protein ACKPKO_56020, partial [Candidatus Fonsibacter sp.]